MHADQLYRAPRTRQSAVTCLSFGPNRKETYPGYFFCHGCDLFEDAIMHGNKRANRAQRKYQCTGGHEGDWSQPTTPAHNYRPQQNKKLSTDADEQSVSGGSTKSPLKKKCRQHQSSSASSAVVRRVVNYYDETSVGSSDDGGEEELIGRRLFSNGATHKIYFVCVSHHMKRPCVIMSRFLSNLVGMCIARLL
jgi:hypothetical protein